MQISEEHKRAIDEWLAQNNRNQYGDEKEKTYAGGNPLFDERLAAPRDRYEYILSRHPELKRAVSP